MAPRDRKPGRQAPGAPGAPLPQQAWAVEWFSTDVVSGRVGKFGTEELEMVIVIVDEGDHGVCFCSKERESRTAQAFTKQ